MNQAPSDGRNLLDPFGVWKAARDTNIEAWSKMMIEIVNSDEYARSTGLALEQILATSQPLRDAMERTMTQTLSMLNMPSRAEVISLAERLVNVEMRLDDLDAKLNTVQSSLQETIKKTVHEATTSQNSQLKDLVSHIESMDARYASITKIEAHLADLAAKLNELRVAAPVAAQPVSVPATKVEPKPQPKAEARPAQRTSKQGSPIKEQEAK